MLFVYIKPHEMNHEIHKADMLYRQLDAKSLSESVLVHVRRGFCLAEFYERFKVNGTENSTTYMNWFKSKDLNGGTRSLLGYAMFATSLLRSGA